MAMSLSFVIGITLGALGLEHFGCVWALLRARSNLASALALVFGIVLFLVSDVRMTPVELEQLPSPVTLEVHGMRRVGDEMRFVYRVQPENTRRAFLVVSRTDVAVDLPLLEGADGSEDPSRAVAMVGRRFRAMVQCRALSAPGLPGEYHAQNAAAAQGISGEVRLSRVDQSLAGRSYALALRARLRESLMQQIRALGGEGGALMTRVVLGAQVPQKPEIAEELQDLGLAHLLAASGLHVSLLLNWGMHLASMLPFSRKKSLVVLFALLFGYAALLDFPASILRALFYAIIQERALQKHRRVASWKRLIGALALVLLFFPMRIFDLGLKLSFLCAVAMAWHATRPRPKSATAESLLFTSRLFLVTWPVMARHNLAVTPTTLIANALALPAFSALFALGLLAVFLAPVPVLGSALTLVFRLFMGVFTQFIHGLSVLALPSWEGTLSPWTAYLYTAFVLFLVLFATGFCRQMRRRLNRPFLSAMRERREWCMALYTCAVWGALAMLLPWAFRGLEGPTLTALNVGQGDAFLLQVGGHNVLIDTGGESHFRSGENTQAKALAEELLWRGVSQCDAVFLSHDDQDHAGNLWGLCEKIPVRSVYVAPGTRRDIAPPDVSVDEVHAHQQFRLISKGGIEVRLTVLSPGRGDAQEKNNHSMVVSVEMGGAQILFMGDQEKTDESVWRELQPPLSLLKVAHHGSKNGTGAELLERLRPERAIVSAGAGNRYGHPAEETLQRLRRFGVRVDRTDEQSHVQYAPSLLPWGPALVSCTAKERCEVHAFVDALWVLGLYWCIKKGRRISAGEAIGAER